MYAARQEARHRHRRSVGTRRPRHTIVSFECNETGRSGVGLRRVVGVCRSLATRGACCAPATVWRVEKGLLVVVVVVVLRG
jgi:hypothetical protein